MGVSGAKCSLLALVGLAACRPSAMVFVEPPPLAESKSVFVAVDTVVDLRVFLSVVSSDPIEIALGEVDSDRAVTVEMVGVPRSLESLGLAAGELEHETVGEIVTLPLDAPSASFRLTIDNGTVSDWTEAAPSPTLRGFTIDNPNPCPALRLGDRRELEVMEFAAIVARPDNRLLLRRRGRDREAMLTNSTFGTIEVLPIETPVAFTHGAVSSDTSAWVADDTHAWLAPIDDETKLVATSTVTLPVSRSESIAVDGATVYVHGRGRDVWRLAPNEPPELLGTLEDTRGSGLFIAPMALEAGKLVTGNSNSNQTLVYQDGRVTYPPRLPADGVRALIWVPGMATFVAGTIDGTLYELADDVWVLMERLMPSESQIRALAPLGDGFVYVSGDIIGLFQGGIFCPDLLPGSDVRHLSSKARSLHTIVDGDAEAERRAILELRVLD